MKSKQNNKKQKVEDHFELNDFNIKNPEVIREPMQIVPKYEGKLKMPTASISLPRYVVDDLRKLARIKGMSSYQLSKTGYSFCQVYLILMVSRKGIFDKGEGVLILCLLL